MPGFLFGRRHRRSRVRAGYFNFYLVETPDVLTSKPYLERLDHPTPMTKHNHVGGVHQHEPHGMPARRAPRRLSRRLYRHRPVQRAAGRGALSGVLEKLMADTAVAGGEIWIALDPAGMPVSMEEKLRGGDKKIQAR